MSEDSCESKFDSKVVILSCPIKIEVRVNTSSLSVSPRQLLSLSFSLRKSDFLFNYYLSSHRFSFFLEIYLFYASVCAFVDDCLPYPIFWFLYLISPPIQFNLVLKYSNSSIELWRNPGCEYEVPHILNFINFIPQNEIILIR